MKKKPDIELLARGVCVDRGQLLVCHGRGAHHTYLPGGHVEFAENAKESLTREIEEEMGRRAIVGRFLGAVEHSFIHAGRRHCELNLCFAMRVAGLRGGRVPESAESYLDFKWRPMACLGESDLEPQVLRGLLPRWLGQGSRAERWAATHGTSFRSPS